MGARLQICIQSGQLRSGIQVRFVRSSILMAISIINRIKQRKGCASPHNGHNHAIMVMHPRPHSAPTPPPLRPHSAPPPPEHPPNIHTYTYTHTHTRTHTHKHKTHTHTHGRLHSLACRGREFGLAGTLKPKSRTLQP